MMSMALWAMQARRWTLRVALIFDGPRKHHCRRALVEAAAQRHRYEVALVDRLSEQKHE